MSRELVVDTNVFIDIHSCHDLIGPLAELRTDLTQEQVRFRRRRARESLLMAFFLDATGAVTYSLPTESLDVLEGSAPAGAEAGHHFPSDFTRTVVWFVNDYVFPGWQGKFVELKKGTDWTVQISYRALLSTDLLDSERELSALATDEEPKIDRTKSHVLRPLGNDADLWHIADAKQRGLQLVTNEGFGPSGYGVGRISKRAASEGVKTLFPKDVYAGSDETHCARDLFRRITREAPRYLRDRERLRGSDLTPRLMNYWILPYYEYVLFE